jgi:hypothetical protein
MADTEVECLRLTTSGIPLGPACAGSGIMEGIQSHRGRIDNVAGGLDARVGVIVKGETTATVTTGVFRVGFGNRHDDRLPQLRSSRIGGLVKSRWVRRRMRTLLTI